MTTDQIMALLRQVLPILGTLAVSFGWIAPDHVAPYVATILSVAGPAMIFGSAIWAAIANTKSSIISSVSSMPEVSTPQLVNAINDPTLQAAAANATQVAK